jgi:hypothetical protein
MSDSPTADELVAAYEDDVEALARLWHARGVVTADARSRFHRLKSIIDDYLREIRVGAPDFPRI